MSLPDLDPPLWETAFQRRWIRAVNRTSARLFGAERPRLDPDRMIRRARRRTGLTDFGPETYREGLDVLVESFRRWDGVHAFGRWAFRRYCETLLGNRLQLQRDFTRFPEIDAVPVPAPVFILGPPRSGTTLLQRLLSTDPAGRPLLYWETLWPSPPPDPKTRTTDARIRKARGQVALVDRLAPGVAPGHELGAELPEEDNNLFGHRFEAGVFGFMFDVPDYVQWLGDRDRVPAYQFARRQLQHLSWKVRGDHWVLKAPTHLFGLDALLAVFPDARIIMTHRDPAKVVPSVCRLAAAFRGLMADRVDLRSIGAEFCDGVARGLDTALATRATADPARFFDVGYPDLVADPIGTLRSICTHFDLDFSPSFEQNARSHLASHPQGRRGSHRYDLADFGLSPARVEAAFAPYLAWTEAQGIPTGRPSPP